MILRLYQKNQSSVVGAVQEEPRSQGEIIIVTPLPVYL